MTLATIGLSHHTAPLERRERVALRASELPEALQRLRERFVLDEAVILSTCNRTELYVVCSAPQRLDTLGEFFNPATGPRPWPGGPAGIPPATGGRDARPTRDVGEGAMGLPVGLHDASLPLYTYTDREAVAHLAQIDIAIICTQAPHYVITPEDLEMIRPLRSRWPLCLIDLAVPRNIDPAARELPGIRLYDVDDLQAMAGEGPAIRRQAVAASESLIEHQVAHFMRWQERLETREEVCAGVPCVG